MIRGELAQRVEELTAARAPFVEATVVRAQSPTSVRPGDKAIVRRDGTIDGLRRRHLRRGVGAPARAAGAGDREPVLLRILPGDAAEPRSRSRER